MTNAGKEKRPPLEILESFGVSETWKRERALWITAQCSMHLLNSCVRRDPRTGEPLPQALLDLLATLGSELKANIACPMPADRIQQAAEFVLEPIRNILDKTRTRIRRDHILQPIHRLRELDAKCNDWLGRQPGRTIREKLAGRTNALGVVREFDVDTHENRVVRRVAHVLAELLTLRSCAAKGGAFGLDELGQSRLDTIEECVELLGIRMRQSPLDKVPAALSPGPSNVLLNDRNYSKLWRAWLWLRNYEDDLDAIWTSCEDRFRTALFWATVAKFADRPEVEILDTLTQVATGYGSTPLEVRELQFVGTRPNWTLMTNIGLLVRSASILPEHRSGRITHTCEPTGGRRFGIIESRSSPDHYFDSKSLAPGVSLKELKEGDSVVFLPPESEEGKAPLATELQHTPRPKWVRIVLEGKRLRIVSIPLRGNGVLTSDCPHAQSLSYDISFNSSGAIGGRGIPFTCRESQPRGVDWFSGVGDLRGLSHCADEIVTSVMKSNPKCATAPCSAHAIRHVGADLCGVVPQVDTGVATTTATLLYAIPYDGGDLGQQWLVGRNDRLIDEGAASGMVAMGDVMDAGSSRDQGLLALAAVKMFEALRADILTDDGARGQQHFACVVRDTLDEFSQVPLRSAMATVFGQALPIWRSVALALGWQQSCAFANAQIEPGDVLVCFDPTGDALSATFLVARHHDKLEAAFPGSRGIYWERRPPLSNSTYPERLARLATALTLPALLREYAEGWLRGTVVPDEDELAEEKIGPLVEKLLSLGLIERIILERKSITFPLAVGDSVRLLQLRFDLRLWRSVAIEWSCRLGQYLEELARLDIFNDLLHDTLHDAQHNCHFVFAGLPFSIPEVRDALSGGFASRAQLARFHFHALKQSERCAAEGSRHFLERRERGLPSWEEWLPELYLEVVKDGHFHELQLMQEVSASVTDGKTSTFEVAEQLMLPAGQLNYQFALLAGRRRYPLHHEANLISSAFPLAKSLKVRLRLAYRYGLENAYDLAILTEEAVDAPFRQIRASWRRRTNQLSEPPQSPLPFGPSLARPEKDKERLLEQAKRFVENCNCFFGGAPKSDEEFRGFTENTTRKWNADLQSQDRWTVPTNRSVDLTIFAEWMRRRLEVPLLRMWLNGHAWNDDRELRALIRSDFGQWLSRLAGLDEAHSVISKELEPVCGGERELKGIAMLLLSRLQRDAPQRLVIEVANLLKSDTQDSRFLHHILNGVPFLLLRTDAPGHACRGALLHRVHKLLQLDPHQARAVDAATLHALSSTLWRYPELVFLITDRMKSTVSCLFDGVEQYFSCLVAHFEELSEQELQIQEWLVCDSCEILLAFLRLRNAEPYRRWLRAGNPALLRLAWWVRRIDGNFAKLGRPIRPSIRFSLQKPDGLHRVSDLAYVLNCYLTGDSAANLIQIASVDEEDED